MKYTVIIDGKKKVVEAAQFFCEGRFIVFAHATPEPKRDSYGMGGSWSSPKPTPVAAFPMDFVDSVVSDAVTEQPA